MLLYPDDPTHAACMGKLEQGGYKFAAILHDSDVWEEDDPDIGKHEIGSPKKAHWHVVLKFPQAKWSTSISKELGIKSNYIRECNSFDDALLYLTHEKYQKKHQYPFDQVFGPLAPALGKLLIDDDEGMRVLEIVRMIDDTPGIVSYRELLIKVCNNGLYGDFRKLGGGVKWLVDEHNAELKEAYLMQQARKCERLAFEHFEREGSDNVSFSTRIKVCDKHGLLPDK